MCAEPGTCFSQCSTTFSKYFLRISVFRRNVKEICALLGFYAEQNGNFVVLDCLTLGDGTDRLFRNVGSVLLDWLTFGDRADRLSRDDSNYHSTLRKIPQQRISFFQELCLGHTTSTYLHKIYSGCVSLHHLCRIPRTVLLTQLYQTLFCLKLGST